LLVNAERKSVAEVIAQCKAELEKRDAAKPRKASEAATEVKEFEHDMSGQLATVGRDAGNTTCPKRRESKFVA